MLYPDNTASRLRVSLDGVWEFALIPMNTEYDAKKPLKDGRPMPVPCSYNDVYEGREIRDHVGDVVYERFFDAPEILRTGKLMLHFGSVTHAAKVWLNGEYLGSHKGGFLPFAFDITDKAKTVGNRLTVVANNIVDYTTLPCGTVQSRTYPGMEKIQFDIPNFDFFNYSGIMRPVMLYALPKTHINSIYVGGKCDGSFEYEITANHAASASVRVLDEKNHVLWQGEGMTGSGKVENVTCWCPETPALYRLEVNLSGEDGSKDVYEETFGFREVEVKDCKLYLNGKPIYLKGFGKHEDFPVNGRGFNEAVNVKDINLLKWIGCNSFRTSHYPYSEEMMRLCDRMGILVIDEPPAVGMETTFTANSMPVDVIIPTWQALKTKEHHEDVLRDLIARDQNHPCVIMWSVTNEPASEEPGAYNYFAPLFDLVRKLDRQHRPVTFAARNPAKVHNCEVAPLSDVIMLNRYHGWYYEEGNLAAAGAILSHELDQFHARYPEKPIMLSEFGADAVAGMHDTTALMFSEEYQRDMIQTYCEVLDSKEFTCGEHVWNFADFATAESVKRVQGNKKGVFTRERKPKLAAWYLKDRWNKMD